MSPLKWVAGDDPNLDIIRMIGQGASGNVYEVRSSVITFSLTSGAQFEPSKYILVHFTRNKNLETTASIKINGIKIEPSNEAKYLGVIFDKELRYHSHLQHVIRKGTSAAIALFSIAKNSWGAPYNIYANSFRQSSHLAWTMLPQYGTDQRLMEAWPAPHR